MPFNVTGAPALTGFTNMSGVESVVLTWDATALPVEIWRGPTDDFASATLITQIAGSTFTDEPLPADQPVYHFARTVQQLTTGGVLAGPVSMVGTLPARAELGIGQVITDHVAENAITSRELFSGGSTVWVRQGTDGNNNLAPAGDAADTVPPFYFLGSGNEVVVHAIARVMEAYPIFRYTGSAAGLIECRIIDITDNDENETDPYAGELIDMQTLICYGASYTLFPGATQPATLVFNRDFDVNFVIATQADHTYKVQFWLGIQNGNLGNYLYMMSDLQQVFWSEFKR